MIENFAKVAHVDPTTAIRALNVVLALVLRLAIAPAPIPILGRILLDPQPGERRLHGGTHYGLGELTHVVQRKRSSAPNAPFAGCGEAEREARVVHGPGYR